MRFARVFMTCVTTLALAVVLVGAGFLACALPPVTRMLAGTYADEVDSPFERAQLVEVAAAARDYSFGAHDKTALFRVIYEENVVARPRLRGTDDKLPAGFPRLDLVSDPTDLAQLEAAFADASETYVFSPDSVAHLDDCNAIARVAYPALAVAAVVAAVGIAVLVKTGGRHAAGLALVAAGGVVLVALAALGAFAAIDFNRFFMLFHGVFFSQGNWQFPYDSLLICSLPTPFWVGMGAIWLACSVVASLACVVVGRRLGN